MRRTIGALAGAAMLFATVLTAVPAAANTIGDAEGCTPGYWKAKQHFDSWQEAEPGDDFSDTFEFAGEVPDAIDDFTMLGALQAKGGSGLSGAQRILARAAAAAWLNAAHEGVEYPWRREGNGLGGRTALEEAVRDAMLSGSRSTILALATRLDKDNNLGCPLS